MTTFTFIIAFSHFQISYDITCGRYVYTYVC